MTISSEIQVIVDVGVDRMISDVQKLLGIKQGDVAAQHFSDRGLHNQIYVALLDYVIAELQSQIDTLQGEKL